MNDRTVLWHIKQLGLGVFTTHDICSASGKSYSNVVQVLNILEREGVFQRVHRGIWVEAGNAKVSPYAVAPYLSPRHRAYVSFISALHLHGLIEQIPQIVTLATTAHTRIVRTRIATYHFHRIHPAFFTGFGWYKGTGTFLIAEPEKALIDSLYLSTRRKRQYGYFPEIYLPRSFSIRTAKNWIKRIPDYRIRVSVEKKLESLLAPSSYPG